MDITFLKYKMFSTQTLFIPGETTGIGEAAAIFLQNKGEDL